MNWQSLATNPRVVATGIALLVTLVLAVAIRIVVGRFKVRPEQRQRAQNAMRYGLALLLVIFLIAVWADVIRSMAIVASAVAVALVLASKELLMCIMGWWVKMTSDAFHIGDRIEIGDVKGDVMDYGLLTTTLLRVGTDSHDEFRTGTIVTVPNSAMLSSAVHNLTHSSNFKWEEIEVRVGEYDDWSKAEAALLAAAQEETAEYLDEVREHIAAMEKRFAFHAIQADPRVFVSPDDDGGLLLSLRLPVPVRGARHVEDRIMRSYLHRRADEGDK